MIKLYGTTNGFGRKLNEIVGSQIVSVRLSLPLAKTKQASITFIASLVAIFAALFVLINLMLRQMFLQRVKAMAEIANKVSRAS